MSLRTKTLLLFLTFVLVPLGAVGVVASIGTRMGVERTVRRSLEASIRSVTADLEEDLASAPRSSQRSDEQAAAVRIRDELEARSLTAFGTEDVLAPLNRIIYLYVALILLVAAAATMGFRTVSHRIFRSLDEFRNAVEQIAHGDFAPWLPPPGRDEVGWLSLALSRMAERMGRMVQNVEQAGRLAVVGEMAAHMAHEVRTPLSSIKMNLQMLDRTASAEQLSESTRVSIDTSLREIARLETIVHRILEFGVPESGSRQRCSLHGLIAEAVELLRPALEKAGVEVRLDLDAESDWVSADAGRVKGVFLNLLVNARDAMPRGGEVLIETQLFLGDGGQQMVAVAVSDSGPGVPTSLRDQIFHPFFTTKADGCGIGLPAAVRTLHQHGGDLYLSERPDGGVGGCFVALFPLAPPSLDEHYQAPAGDGAAAWSLGGEWRNVPSPSVRWTRVSDAEAVPLASHEAHSSSPFPA